MRGRFLICVLLAISLLLPFVNAQEMNFSKDHYARFPLDGHAIDKASGRFNGTIFGTPVNTTDAIIGTAMEFDNTNTEYINIGEFFLDWHAAKDFTISVWQKSYVLDAVDARVSFGLANGDHSTPSMLGIGTRAATSSVMGYYAIDSVAVVEVNSALTPLNWSFMVLVVNVTAGTVSLYANGSLVGSDTYDGTFNELYNVDNYIGALSPAHPAWTTWNGVIDEVNVWNRTLGDTEIFSLWANQSVGLNVFDGAPATSLVWDLQIPINNTGINLNPIDFLFNLTTPETGSTCVLVENDAVVNTSVYNQGINTISVNSTETGFTDFYINCTVDGGIYTTSLKTLFLDFTQPYITWTEPNNASTIGHLLPYNISMQDNNLFATRFEIRTDNGTIILNLTETNISGYNISYSGEINVSNYGVVSYFSLFAEAKDGHTANQLNKDWVISDIPNGLRFNASGVFYDISIFGKPLNGKTALNMGDRYSFEFDINDNNHSQGKRVYTFIIDSENPLIYRQNSEYMGHLIDPINNIWIDFEGEHTLKAFAKLNERKYRLQIETDNRKVTFNSIGELNVNNDTRIVFQCSPSFSCDTFTCTQEDNETCTAASANNSCEIPYTGDFSEFEVSPCDFCTEEIVEERGVCSFNSQTVGYTDNNYDSCCALTNLTSDCSVDFDPFNETTFLECKNFKTMDCQYSPYPNLKLLPKNIQWACNILDNSQVYECLTYVYDFRGHLWQTNPQREFVKDIGAIDSYRSNNGLVNVEFKPDLTPDINYTFFVECNAENSTAIFNATVTPVIEDISGKAVNTGLWAGKNFGWLLIAGTVLMLIFVMLTFGAIWLYRSVYG